MTMTLRAIHERAAGGADVVTRESFGKLLAASGASGMVAGKVIDGFAKKFGERVNWDGFRRRGAELLPGLVPGVSGDVAKDVAAAMALFDQYDRAPKGVLSFDELKRACSKAIEAKQGMLAAMVASDSAARVLLALTGKSREGSITRAEFEALVTDILKQANG
jgi:hypothetical protein